MLAAYSAGEDYVINRDRGFGRGLAAVQAGIPAEPADSTVSTTCRHVCGSRAGPRGGENRGGVSAAGHGCNNNKRINQFS